MTRKPVVAVIFGGASNEHDASLLTAGQVFAHIDRDRWDPFLYGIDRTGGWHRVDSVEELAAKEAVGPTLPDLSGVDLAFPLVHGHNGEDGTMQGLLQLAGIAYAGSGVLASAIGMDKVVAQRLFDAVGIPTVPTTALTAANRGDAALEAQTHGYPVFVKPNQSGTSVGVSRVDEPAQLEAALTEAFRHDGEVLVQPRIVGREIEIAVLQDVDGSLRTSPPLQVTFDESRPFLDYTAKYTDGMAHYVLPAPVTDEQQALLSEYALRAFRARRAERFARVDFFVTDEGAIHLNEINTIPGFTAFSHYPRMWAAAGVPMAELVQLVLERGLAARSR